MELSARQTLINSFLEASHGRLQAQGEKHARALELDPALYGHLSRWYQQNGTLRDHHELFGAHLLNARDPEFRSHAKVLVQTLRPYQLARLVRYSKEVLKNRNRSLKSAVLYYLQRREADPLWFDECVLRDRRSMRYLYATLHIRPGLRAQQVLFQEKPPADSRLRVLRQLHGLRSNPRLQAQLIRDYRIQFTTALGVAGPLVPELLESLVYVMTPQQLINNLGFLQRRGALEVPALRARVMEKIQLAKTESRVHDAKSLTALKHLAPDPGLRRELLEMSQTRLRSRGTISKPTALLVDKSGSMEVCVEIGKMLACLCSTIAEAPLFVEAFDGDSFTVSCQEPTFEAWEKAFRHIRADGWTSLGAPLRKLRDKRFEQILLISDGEENTQPFFCEELRKTGRDIEVIWLKVGGSSQTSLEHSAQRLGVNLRTIPFQGDYYNLPNLVPLLCTKDTLVSEILEVPLYVDGDLQHLPPGFCAETYEIL
ncbi:MAG: hypothetical protein KF760_29850 [Candidatus Eremiobacteraeota bacterium]|nr:hypothetical protein [Candidatus Eremiobacteraeota bacterium]MCW5866913.1 hypothetical protein [Candidatus Eremiobacteraeota bacterium]